MKKFLFCVAALLVPALGISQDRAFPDRPIRIIVHLTAGSGSDASTRFVAERLSKVLGQPVLVENKPGANGAIAVMATKTAPADGYTMLMTSISTLSVNPIVVKGLPYDPLNDLRPVSGLIRVTSGIVVGSDSPYRTFQELVTAARKSEVPLAFGSYAPGYRLTVEWLADIAGMKVANVPYKGASGMLPDAIGGRLAFAITDIGGVDALVKTGKLRLLAVSGEKRVAEFPEVPTVAESGYPEFVNYPWTALHVRAETPDEVTARLSEAMQTVLALQDLKDYARRTPGTDLMPLRPAEMRALHGAELARFRRLADKLGIRPE